MENPAKTLSQAHSRSLYRAARIRLFALTRSRTFKSVLWGAGGLFLGALLFAYISAGEIYDYQDTVDGVHLPHVDAIVVLAGGRGRIASAGDLWYRYRELAQSPLPGTGVSPVPAHPPMLYISGMGPQSNWTSFTHQLRRGVLPVIHPEDVILEKESVNTEENARYVIHYARERGWKRILLMTSSYHMKRARLIFAELLDLEQLPIEIETLSVYQEPFEPGEWRGGLHGVRVTVVEYLKLVWYQTFWNPNAAANRSPI